MTIFRYIVIQPTTGMFNQLYISDRYDILLFTLNYFVEQNKKNKQIKKNISTVVLHLKLMMLIKTFMKT